MSWRTPSAEQTALIRDLQAQRGRELDQKCIQYDMCIGRGMHKMLHEEAGLCIVPQVMLHMQ